MLFICCFMVVTVRLAVRLVTTFKTCTDNTRPTRVRTQSPPPRTKALVRVVALDSQCVLNSYCLN